MKNFTILYTTTLVSAASAIYVHDKYFWSGNHWITFGTKFEKTLFSMGDLLVVVLMSPLVLVLLISLVQKKWRSAIGALISLPICFSSIVVVFLIIGD